MIYCSSEFFLFHFSSLFDDVPADQNTNINDKFWRAALRLGKVGSLPLQVPRWGPFIERECKQLEGPLSICITLSFSSFFVLRYWYEILQGVERDDGGRVINYHEFQWIFFGRMVYNREVNRKEVWKPIHEDVDFVVMDMRNADVEKYDRVVAFTLTQ